MRTKILGPNQRIKIGQGYATMIGDDLAKFAQVLAAVGLTLEIGKLEGRENIIELFAARRMSTSLIALGSKRVKTAAIPDSIPNTPAEP